MKISVDTNTEKTQINYSELKNGNYFIIVGDNKNIYQKIGESYYINLLNRNPGFLDSEESEDFFSLSN